MLSQVQVLHSGGESSVESVVSDNTGYLEQICLRLHHVKSEQNCERNYKTYRDKNQNRAKKKTKFSKQNENIKRFCKRCFKGSTRRIFRTMLLDMLFISLDVLMQTVLLKYNTFEDLHCGF